MTDRARRLAAASLLFASLEASSAFHLWSMKELFSNGDGSVQYLELAALSGGQQFLAGHSLSTNNGGTPNVFAFPSNLPDDTTGRRFLVGTQGFAALGLVTPDYIVPNGFFFRAGGTINFAEGSDSWNHGALPSGAQSLDRTAGAVLNTPANFAGSSATLRFGALDPTFAGGLPGYSVAVQPDGRIVALGDAVATLQGGFSYVVTFGLARYSASGAVELSIAPQVGGCGFCSAAVAGTAATALQADGRIVSTGYVQTSSLNTGACKTVSFVTMRQLPNGGVDTSFNGGASPAGGGEARGLAIQADGKIVVAGSKKNYVCLGAEQPMDTQLVRYNVDGTLDGTFGTSGSVISQIGSGEDMAHAVAIQPDGRIVVAGHATNGANKDWMVARYSAAGALEAAFLHDVTAGSDDVAYALALQADGKMLLAGQSGARSAIARFTSPGALDPAFATGGKFLVPGGAVRALALQPDGKILALTSEGELLRLASDGSLDATFGIGGRFSTGYVNAQSMALQADGKIVVGTSSTVIRVDPNAVARITPDASTIDFGGQSVNTTSPPRLLRLTNTSGSTQTIQTVSVPANFGATHDCASLLAGGSCTVSLTYTPGAEGASSGDVVVTGSAGTLKVFLAGMGERSLVTHYYRSILRRDADAGGKAFWLAEATRVANLGASVNEAWFAMAMQFYFSPEYVAFNRDNTGYVTDLYNTFFNRAPDSGGLGYWVGQLASGMPREVLLAQFMFSPEFRSFTQAIFGTPAVRAEVDAVMDFYRGILGRMPDDGGFNYWIQRFRTAQCQGQAAITAEVEAISGAFTLSGEYAARGRDNTRYVGDLYNAFLRRGGDLTGVQYWIGQLASGARTREQVRVEFKNSPEFQARVNAVIAQGCLQ